jgi:hypothetical protein
VVGAGVSAEVVAEVPKTNVKNSNNFHHLNSLKMYLE